MSDVFATYKQVTPPEGLFDRSDDILTAKSNFEFKDSSNNSFLNDIALNYQQKINPSITESEQDIFGGLRAPSISNKTKVQLKGSDLFEKVFTEAVKQNPEVANYKNFLIKTAQRESGFNSSILNTTGAPYYGYFQMGKNEIKNTTGMTVEEFRNDPVAQILGAVKLYLMNLATIKRLGVYELGKLKGYSDDALVSGAWMGGPGGVLKYLLGKGDPSDSHWYGGKGGSSVGKVMNNWKKDE